MRFWARALVLLLVCGAAAPARAPVAQGSFAAGAVVALRGTPHLWIADDRGVLHWGGDTRGLSGKFVDWGNRAEFSLEQVRGFPRGDPWLSAGLLKLGDPIYLVKWETTEAAPRLLHVQSIADVELFGITGTNYGSFVNELPAWEARYGFTASQLVRAELPPAVAPRMGVTRERPVPLGGAADGGDGWQLAVLGTTPDAWPAIRAADRFNSPPLAGRQYFMARVSVTRTGTTPAYFYRTLQVVGDSNVAFPADSPGCGVVPDRLPSSEVLPGGTLAGNVCWQVPPSEVASLVLSYTTLTSPPSRIFLALR